MYLSCVFIYYCNMLTYLSRYVFHNYHHVFWCCDVLLYISLNICGGEKREYVCLFPLFSNDDSLDRADITLPLSVPLFVQIRKRSHVFMCTFFIWKRWLMRVDDRSFHWYFWKHFYSLIMDMRWTEKNAYVSY